MSVTLKAFITYSHKDKQAKNVLRTYLAVMENEGKIKLWDDNEILPGDEWYHDISSNLAKSDILLYLVSAASLASENCNKELGEGLKNQIRVIPIILEACDWRNHQLKRFEVLPLKGEPINKWEPETDGWQDVGDGIRRVIDKIQPHTVASSGASEKELRAELEFQQGNFLLMLGQIDRAIGLYSHAIDLNPRNADAFNNRGVAHGMKGEFDLAIADFNKMIELKPTDAGAHTNRGIAYQSKGEYDLGIKDHNTAIQLDADYADSYHNRGVAYYFSEKFDCAIVDFTKVLELKSNDAKGYYSRGLAYGKQGWYDRAIQDYNRAIKLRPSYAEAYNDRGAVYYKNGEVNRAIDDYNKAIELKPNFPEGYNNRGNAYQIKGEHNRAIEDFSKAIELKPDWPLAHYNRGLTFLYVQDWARAKPDLISAKNGDLEIAVVFRKLSASIPRLEKEMGVKLPQDIAIILRSS